MLKPFDVIEGASVPGHPRLYVVGCYDSRITFYSQQVRALELVHALHVQGHVSPNLRVAIVGAGAAGITLAAALALTSDASIILYERGDEILPLQRATARRRLDPHIYDWPAEDSDHEFAELPLLDWRAASAATVRRGVMREFGAVVDAVRPRIQTLTRHRVLSIRRIGANFELEFERDATVGEIAAGGQPRVRRQNRVDVVFLAFGFGLEPDMPLPGVPTESYWNDGGVPGPEIAGRVAPRFFVSGNGDGGLIDLVAAATATFDHSGMIRSIIRQPGIAEVFDRLRAIDFKARREHAAGRMFDFVGAYDAAIRHDLARLGLIDLVRGRLRPGVQLIFQTRDDQLMSVETAMLNRLAVYLVIKACEEDALASFRHVHCANVASVAAPAGAMEPASYWFDCGGQIIGVDKAIIRRGPDRNAVRAPFQDILAGFADSHETWLACHQDNIISPHLSDAARDRFTRASREYNLPLPAHAQDAMAARLPMRIQIRPAGGQLRWAGDFPPAEAARAWNGGANGIHIFCTAPPDQLGAVAPAIARLAMHSDQSVVSADPASWRPFLESLSSLSLHSDDLMPPRLQPLGADGAILHPHIMTPDDLRRAVHRSLDTWMLDALDAHLRDYLGPGRDLGHRIGFRTAPELKAQMEVIWTDWLEHFRRDADLLGRFLRLTVCALDDASSVDEAYALVGPKKLKAIIRSTAVALAIAVGWHVMAPHAARPGNLARTSAAGTVRTGHTCAADRIGGDFMAMSAAKFMWNTNFVLLPMISGPSRLATLVAESLVKTSDAQPRLTEVNDRTNIVLTVDEAFIDAVQTGTNALLHLLARVEDAHYRGLMKAIERATE